MAFSLQNNSRPRKRSRQKLLLFLITLALAAPLASSTSTASTSASAEGEQTPLSHDNQNHVIPNEPECINPAIDEFPEDFFTQEERQNGGIVVHLIITMYLCATLGLVCDRYFVPSLELICEILHVPTDIAGATFMAIGTSAPELFSSVIGSFITEGDIGVGAIVGSAVFNVIGITGLAGLAVWKMNVPIDWYPISRDCFAYLLSIIALIAILHDNTVVWYEAVILLVMFVLYVIMMVYNAKLETFSQQQMSYFRSKFSGYRSLDSDLEAQEQVKEKAPLLSSKPTYLKVDSIPQPQKKRVSFNDECLVIRDDSQECMIHSYQSVEIKTNKKDFYQDLNHNEIVLPVESEKGDEDTVWVIPRNSVLYLCFWVATWPICFLMYLTIPDCRKESKRKYYLVTFSMAVAWIMGLTYLSVWMVTIIGYTFGIPDSISGITLLAVGTSVPEIISSIIVVRNGFGNMALCNLLGSNVFNIVFCLGLPWLIKTSLVASGGAITINSAALTYMTITLLSTVVMLYALFIATKWMLNRKVGLICVLMYCGFIVLAVYYELELVTGSIPTCA